VLKADISAKLDQMTTDAAQRDREAVQREKEENQRWIIGLVLACTGIVVAAVALF